jgi:ketosteroid isomerase-like protein
LSQENVEIVREVLDSLEQSARSGTATPSLLARCADSIHVDATRRVFNPESYDGASGIQRLVREMHDAWEDFSLVSERLIDMDDRVLSLHAIGGKGRSSGAEVSTDSALLFSLERGRVVHVVAFTDPDEAVKVLALRE